MAIMFLSVLSHYKELFISTCTDTYVNTLPFLSIIGIIITYKQWLISVINLKKIQMTLSYIGFSVKIPRVEFFRPFIRTTVILN